MGVGINFEPFMLTFKPFIARIVKKGGNGVSVTKGCNGQLPTGRITDMIVV